MFTISDTAAEKAKMILSEEGKEGWGIRVYSAGGGCCGPSYGLDIEESPTEDDNVFEKEGVKVFIDSVSFQTLTGMQLDYLSQDEQEGFVLTGGAPSCGPGCGGGCGSSV